MTERPHATTGPAREYRRIVVIGVAGAGKSTFSRRLGAAWGCPVVERDALGRLGSSEYLAAATAAVAGERWIFDGFPYYVDEVVYQRAELIVALDYPRWVAAWRVLRRSAALAFGADRGAHPVEGVSAWFRPTHPVRIALLRHGDRRREINDLVAAQSRTADVIRFTTPRDTTAWLTRQALGTP
jgi:hypothetical protein